MNKFLIQIFALLFLVAPVYADGSFVAGPCAAFGTASGTCLQGAGALGSPSSIGTLPAFTLSGTIAGGGNQINNIIVGTTTPLAGTFTTLNASAGFTASAASSVTVPSNNVAALILNVGISSNSTGITFQDNGTSEWSLYKETNNHFLLLDRVNSTTMLDVTPGSSSTSLFAITRLAVPSIASDAATTDNTACVSSSGLFLKGSGTLGICLGTSGAQFKTAFAPMAAGIDDLMKIDFQNYRYREGFGDSGERMQYGPTAQNVEGAIPDLVRHNASGAAINYDSGALLFVGLRSIQQVNTNLEQLKADNDNLRACQASWTCRIFGVAVR